MITAILSMAGLAIAFAAVLAFANTKLRVEEDPRVDVINHLLPGINCGACGYLSCHDLAEHVVREGEDPAKCRVVDEETREKLLELTGREGETTYPYIPLVRCAAEWEHKKKEGVEYKGIKTCAAANLAFGGGMDCEYGCMGFGDCAEVCPFDALHMENGLPRLDQEKCTGCGKCVEACPRNIIVLQEKRFEKLFYVACSTHDGALRVREICKVGCIACGICEKLSQEGFFKVTDNLSRADYSKQADPEKVRPIAAKCPTKVIKEI